MVVVVGFVVGVDLVVVVVAFTVNAAAAAGVVAAAAGCFCPGSRRRLRSGDRRRSGIKKTGNFS